MSGRALKAWTFLALSGALGACGLESTPEAPAACRFPPDTVIVWSGPMTPQDAGLADSQAVRRTGSTYVTEDRVPVHDSLDATQTRMTDGPAYCFVSDSGTVVAIGEVPKGWAPPGS